MNLTYAGERYYQTACRILKIYENLEGEISDINGLRTGRIRMGITNHLGTVVLPKILPPFRRQCPFIELEILEETTDKLENRLLSGQLDFALMHAPKEDSHPLLNYEFLANDPFVIAMAPNHPLASQADVYKRQLLFCFIQRLFLVPKYRISRITAYDLLHGPLYRILGILPVFIFIDIIKLLDHPVNISLHPIQFPVHLVKKHWKKLLLLLLGQSLTTSFYKICKMMYTEALGRLYHIHKFRLMLYLIHKGIHHAAVGIVHPLTDVTVAFFPSDPLSYRIAVLRFFLK